MFDFISSHQDVKIYSLKNLRKIQELLPHRSLKDIKNNLPEISDPNPCKNLSEKEETEQYAEKENSDGPGKIFHNNNVRPICKCGKDYVNAFSLRIH